MALGQLRAAPVRGKQLSPGEPWNELFLSNPVMVLRIGQVLD